jgi:hypothetical protein
MKTRRVLAAVMALTLAPAFAYAQVDRGTIELSTTTGFLMNKQTLSPPDDPSGTSDLNLTTITIGLDLTYFTSARFGIGAIVNQVSFNLEGADGSGGFKTNGTIAGGLVKLAFPAGGRNHFFIIGSGGIASTKVESEGSDAITHKGFYWLGGGGVAFWLNDHVSLNGVVRYQGSKFSDDDTFDLNAAGLIAGVGFSVYLGGNR